MNRWSTAQRRAKKAKLFRQQGTRCWLCGKRMRWNEMSFDHIIPRSKGGDNSLDNLALAHVWCNNARGDNDGIAFERRA